MSKKLKNTFYSLYFYRMAFNISVVVYTNTPLLVDTREDLVSIKER